MHKRRGATGSATAIAIALVGLGLAVGWLAIAPAVFGAGARAYVPSAAAAPESAPVASAAALASGDAIAVNLQTSQPRDPFRPLILDGDLLGNGSGGRNGITFRVISAESDANGVPSVTVELNGVSYTVGVGDTFAGAYKVISITPGDADAGTLGRAVFLFGDNAFEVVEGQEILK